MGAGDFAMVDTNNHKEALKLVEEAQSKIAWPRTC
jgi:hypothetical protein